MTTPNAPFRPSPLSFNSNRTSPFRRPSTPNSSPTPGRPGTPGSSPSRGYTPLQSPSKLKESYTVDDDDSPKSTEPIPQPQFTRDLSPSPTKGGNSPSNSSTLMGTRSNGGLAASNDAATHLTPAQLREIREAFQVLDRDNDGSVNKDDVADVLQNVGQDSSLSTISQFFSASGAQTMNFPTFLNILSNLLAPISSRQELLNALAAFDDDDSGQIDVASLREALLNTPPEPGVNPLTEREVDEVLNGFTGRRAFGGRTAKANGNRGEIFRYHEFINGIMGTEAGNSNGRRPTDAAQV